MTGYTWIKQHARMHEAEGEGDLREIKMATYGRRSLVNGSKASPAYLLKSPEATDCHFLVCRVSSLPGYRGRWLMSGHGRRSDAGVQLLKVHLTTLGGGYHCR